MLWAGRIMSALPALFLLVDGGAKLFKPAPVVETKICWAGLSNFFNTNAKECPLSFYGITLYGTVDVGVGYDTHGLPFNKYAIFGENYLVSKGSNKAGWYASPNAVEQSKIGVKIEEPIAGDVSLVGKIEAGFDPFSFRLSNGPQSLVEQNGIPINAQSSSGDSARAGQWYNSQAYAGLSSKTWGTLTAGRVNSFLLDYGNRYDPTRDSYAFSVLGFQGAWKGGGDTENTRPNTAVKYIEQYEWFRVGGLYQFGGYRNGNSAQTAWQVTAGFDYDKFSVDATYAKTYGAIQSKAWDVGKIPAAFGAGSLNSTISDNSAFMIAAKYDIGPVRLFGGWENINYANPNSPPAIPVTALGGYTFGGASTTAYTINKTANLVWTGATYNIWDNLSLTGAYYHSWQNDFSGGVCSTLGIKAANGACSGTQDAVSGLVDWFPVKRFDVYAGAMYSQVRGGLANGFVQTLDPTLKTTIKGSANNFNPTAGLRISF